MKEITQKEIDRIQPNYSAFVANFGTPKIEKDTGRRGAYIVYYPFDAKESMQWCNSIEYLNGWLYGCVQASIRGEFKKGRLF